MAADIARPGWLDDPDVPPTVLLLGGFLSAPPMYRPLRRRLLARGAAEVVVASAWPPDWLLISLRGHRALVARSARALLEAGTVASARSKGAPVLVIGHSAGGVYARLLTSPVAFEGRRLGGAERIGAIVTLGTPHAAGSPWRMAASHTAFANEHVPGAFWAPRIRYLAVASRSAPGIRDGTGAERWRWRTYRPLVAPSGGELVPERIDGDGVVPLECALLDGADSLVFDDADHGTLGRWYGSAEVVDRWWDVALGLWRDALAVRRAAAGGIDRGTGAGSGGRGPDLSSGPPAPGRARRPPRASAPSGAP